MKTSRAFALLATALLLAGLPACNQGPVDPAGSRVKVGFVSNNAEEFWTIAEAGTRKASADLGVDVFFRRPAVASAVAQKEIIDDLLTRGVQAIAISVIDPVNQQDYLNKVADQVPLITQDNDAPQTRRKCYIGTDNYEAGKAAGKLVKEALPNGGTIAIFVGQPDPLNARQRRQGVLDELAGTKGNPDAPPAGDGAMYGKYKLQGTYYDNAVRSKAKDNASDVLTRLQDEKDVCLVGLWAYNPPAMLAAVKAAGKEKIVHIVGFDEDENTLLGIREGSIQGTIVQQPFEFGYQSAKLMSELVKDPKKSLPKDGILHVPHKVITKSNVDEFHEKLKELKRPAK